MRKKRGLPWFLPTIRTITPISVSKEDESIRFAVDFKTTYRNPIKPWLCNGFTLGSHGKYFEDRQSTKNIQFPYGTYSGHLLGIIYDRVAGTTIDETQAYPLDELHSITSVISNIQFFVAEKRREIAGDKGGRAIRRTLEVYSELAIFLPGMACSQILEGVV